ncbi:MAG TPA: cytochrome c oxidase assembly protein [Acidimicrobiales bacterium]|nr:cytochrome c oxidase assembly protein [Acidimicrobiales bacterium]
MTVIASVSPFGWDLHPVAWAALLAAVLLTVIGHRRLMHSNEHPIRWSRHQVEFFAGACGGLVVALTWPVADLADRWSLTALVVQRLVLVLAVAPMLLLGLPHDVQEWATRGAFVDATLVRLRRPPVAVVTVTILLVGSMAPNLVEAQASSAVLRGALLVLILIAGLILWLPVLSRVPGIPRLRPMVRFGYLAAQGIVPAFLSFILILSPHLLYRTFARSHAAIGLRPLNDQQIAGFVSKLAMLIVLLTVGSVYLLRADEEASTEDPLVWADIQRQFERADRKGSSDASVPSGTALPSE